MRLLYILLIAIFGSFSTYAYTVSINADNAAMENSITRYAIDDVQQLLGNACGCQVYLNRPDADVSLILSPIDTSQIKKPTIFSKGKTYPYSHYPDHAYEWTGKNEGGKWVYRLKSNSFQGLAFGLYGLLQEQLGFSFFHPRQTIKPNLSAWPLANLDWTASPRFDKKGFHLHTMHPLELTEQLLDEDRPNALQDVKQYIDWLVRNGQNYFEFNLLEGIDRKHWPSYAKQIVDYGHQRGILMGIDVSLHMVQQKAYMLYKTFPASWRTKEKQIDRNLKWLMQAPWDYVNMEFSTTEFSNSGMEEKEKLRLGILKQLKEKYHAHLLGREHVVRKAELLRGGENSFAWDSNAVKLDKERGVLIHTVMFYSATDEKAPVYRNENLRHMLDMLLQEKQVRETWYYPESAYWITFDNSVPMMLLPYLSARLEDINTMDSLQIPGHITFSSGWEWGYWLIDWSIARWSWNHRINGELKKYSPTVFLEDLFPKPIVEIFSEATDLQDEYIKDKELIRYMAPSTITDEMPAPIDLAFQPRPQWKYSWLRYKAPTEALDTVKLSGIAQLRKYATLNDSLLKNLHTLRGKIGAMDSLTLMLLDELADGLRINSLRALHRAYTLEALIIKRKADIAHQPDKESKALLEKAKDIRVQGLGVVARREANYRYPLQWIAEKRKDHTCYHFGYLYTTSYLHFWYREEQQIRNDRYGPFYLNIYNIPRIVGIIN
ncbi:MAG: hypothetical protein SFW35_12515 [Chitinophagales bacterium]|nr:hypothetical protein [Chitinophagales bacterium]